MKAPIRKPRAAGHERRDHDRREAVVPVLDRARGHDSGNGAGEGREEWKEGASREADRSHHAIHDEGGARHVARVLHERDEEEEDRELGEERGHGARARDHPIHEERADRTGGQRRVRGSAEPSERRREHIHRGLRPDVDALEHGAHEEDEQDGPEDAVREHAIETGAYRRAARDAPHHLAHDLLDGLVAARRVERLLHREPVSVAVRVIAVRLGLCLVPIPIAVSICVIQRRAKPVDPASRLRRHGEHRDAEQPLHGLHVDPDALRLGRVDQVQNEDRGSPGRENLEREVELALEVGRVHDRDHAIRNLAGLTSPLEDVAHDRLVGRARGEAVRSREIDDLQPAARRELARADLLLDGHAGIIRDFLAKSREAVEKGRFPRVGAADDGDALRQLRHEFVRPRCGES
jgi:hypothetical protein